MNNLQLSNRFITEFFSICKKCNIKVVNFYNGNNFVVALQTTDIIGDINVIMHELYISDFDYPVYPQDGLILEYSKLLSFTKLFKLTENEHILYWPLWLWQDEYRKLV